MQERVNSPRFIVCLFRPMLTNFVPLAHPRTCGLVLENANKVLFKLTQSPRDRSFKQKSLQFNVKFRTTQTEPVTEWPGTVAACLLMPFREEP